MQATRLWSLWQGIVLSFALGFTARGKQRFVQWLTGLALNAEEHTITQSLVALGRPQDWKALESFAEYGGWHQGRVTYDLTRLIADAPGRTWHGYRVSAVDDTTVHRNSPGVWGTCTSHAYSARCPDRAADVLVRDAVDDPEGVLALDGLDHAAAQMDVPVGIGLVHDRDRHARVRAQVRDCQSNGEGSSQQQVFHGTSVILWPDR